MDGKVLIVDGQGRHMTVVGEVDLRVGADDDGQVVITVSDETRSLELTKALRDALAMGPGLAAPKGPEALKDPRYNKPRPQGTPHWRDGRPRWVILPGRGVGVRGRDERKLYTPHPDGGRKARRARARQLARKGR